MDHNQRKCHTAMHERSPLFDIMIYSRDKAWLAGMFLTQEQMQRRSVQIRSINWTNISSHHEFKSRQATNEKRCGGLTAPVNLQWAHIKTAIESFLVICIWANGYSKPAHMRPSVQILSMHAWETRGLHRSPVLVHHTRQEFTRTSLTAILASVSKHRTSTPAEIKSL